MLESMTDISHSQLARRLKTDSTAMGSSTISAAAAMRRPGAGFFRSASGCGVCRYQAETIDVSKAMGELSLLPTIRITADVIVVADGTSCRRQIKDRLEREAIHVVQLLASSVAAAELHH
jgi:hypothetical protein